MSESIELSGDKYETYVKNKSVDEFLNKFQEAYGGAPLKSENYTDKVNINDFVTVDFTPTYNTETSSFEYPVDLSKLLRIYANYKKEAEDDSITLYFNYFNWLDSPYVKIENNLLYVDTIEGTYLKLKSGEDGMLDIVLQARYYIGGRVYGY